MCKFFMIKIYFIVCKKKKAIGDWVKRINKESEINLKSLIEKKEKKDKNEWNEWMKNLCMKKIKYDDDGDKKGKKNKWKRKREKGRNINEIGRVWKGGKYYFFLK